MGPGTRNPRHRIYKVTPSLHITSGVEGMMNGCNQMQDATPAESAIFEYQWAVTLGQKRITVNEENCPQDQKNKTPASFWKCVCVGQTPSNHKHESKQNQALKKSSRTKGATVHNTPNDLRNTSLGTGEQGNWINPKGINQFK